MGLTANVVGATGLVGQQIVKQLLNYKEYDKVRIFVRKSTGIEHPKLEEHVIDFGQPAIWASLVTGDVLFSALGTTIKVAKTKDNQYLVDYTYQFDFAKAAAKNGVPCYVLVSSMGADSTSSVFYSKMKGKLEDAVVMLDFKRILIFRPSILDGDRKEKRPGERAALRLSKIITLFIFKSYTPTPVDLLAERMIANSLDSIDGYRIFEGPGIFTK